MIAEAYYQLMPSMRGSAKMIKDELGGGGGGEGGGGGGGEGGKILDALKAFGAKTGHVMAEGLGATLKVGATAAFAGIVAVGSKIMVGGWERALAIDQARVKMDVLLRDTGHTTEEVIGNIQTVTDKTQYSTADAANVAALALANNIAVGDDMERTLMKVADAAAVTGVSYDEMGGIFTKIAGQGHLTGMTLLQLERNGMGVAGMLSKSLGISIDDVRKKISDGEVTYEMFLESLSDIDGMAVQLGQTTFPGVTSNISSALSKIGQRFWDPILDTAIPGLNDINLALRDMEPAMRPVIEAWAANFAPVIERASELVVGFIQKVTDFFTSGGMDGLSANLSSLLPVIGGLTGAFGGFLGSARKGVPILGKLLPGISGPFGLIVGIIAGAWRESDAFRSAVGNLFQQFMPLLSVLGEAGGVLQGALKPAMAEIGSVLALVVNAIAPLIPMVATLVQQLMPPLAGLIGQVVGLLPLIVQAALPLVDVFLVLAAALVPIISELFPIIAEIFGAVIVVVADLIAAVAPLISQLAETLIPIIMLVAGVFAQLLSQAILPLVKGIVGVLLPVIRFIIESAAAVIAAILPIIDVIAAILGPIIVWIANVASVFFGKIGEIVQWLGVVFGVVFGKLADGVRFVFGYIQTIIEAVAVVFGVVMDAIGAKTAEVMGFTSGRVTETMDILGSVTANNMGGMADAFEEGYDGILSDTDAFAEALPPEIADMMGDGVDVVAEGMDGMEGLFGEGMDGILSDVSGAGDAINVDWASALAGLGSTSTAGLGDIGSQIGGDMAGINTDLTGSTTQMTTTWTTAMAEMTKAATAGMNGIKTAMAAGLGAALTTLTQFKASASSTMSDASSMLIGAGYNTMQGLLVGLMSRAPAVLAYVRTIAAMIRSEYESAMRISSPARTMIEPGYQTMAGVAEGMADALPLVGDVIGDALEVAAAGLSPGVDADWRSSVEHVQPNQAELSAANTNYEINGLTYLPDSRVAEVMDALFAEVGRLVQMGGYA
jgi:tape measure domain-containing protein